MRIVEKIRKKLQNNWEESGVCIAFLGDSVTQGCFDCYLEDGMVRTQFAPQDGYPHDVEQILSMLYPSVPVQIIHAGVSGGNAGHGLQRLQRDVLSYHPDLCVVCFGLNDCGQGKDGIAAYTASLREIFTELERAQCECIFMTPNRMADHVSPYLRDEPLKQTAALCAQRQNDGVLDAYVQAARTLCAQMGVRVCDCYAMWSDLQQAGVNVTELLSNKINHPTRQMHWLFAGALVQTMLK